MSRNCQKMILKIISKAKRFRDISLKFRYPLLPSVNTYNSARTVWFCRKSAKPIFFFKLHITCWTRFVCDQWGNWRGSRGRDASIWQAKCENVTFWYLVFIKYVVFSFFGVFSFFFYRIWTSRNALSILNFSYAFWPVGSPTVISAPPPWLKPLVTPLFVTISKDMERFLRHERFRNY